MHGKVSLSRLLANRHRTALGLNKSLLFPCKGQFLPMIKASQWIQELLSSWSGGAREISRTCTSFTLAADTSLCVWCQRDLTSLKKKILACTDQTAANPCCCSRARNGWDRRSSALGVCAVPSLWAVSPGHSPCSWGSACFAGSACRAPGRIRLCTST